MLPNSITDILGCCCTQKSLRQALFAPNHTGDIQLLYTALIICEYFFCVIWRRLQVTPLLIEEQDLCGLKL